MAGMAILVLVPIVYLIIAMNTGDLLWISPVFDAQPRAIMVHCFGEDIGLNEGTPRFEELTDLVNQTLSGSKRWDSLSLSEVTYQDYQSHPLMMVLELSYDEPFRVHSPYKFFSRVDSIIIPLEGRHAITNAVFGRRGDFPAAGSFHVKTTAPLVEYLTVNGLCPQP
jgi:hypothetical protein